MCFPLYAASKEIVKRYKPFLDEIGLTYTQYISMLVIWEQKQISIKSLGDLLYLDSGTLTPVVKRLEKQGMITRQRSQADERSLIITLTEEGEKFQEKARFIPKSMAQCVNLSFKKSDIFYKLLYKILEKGC